MGNGGLLHKAHVGESIFCLNHPIQRSESTKRHRVTLGSNPWVPNSHEGSTRAEAVFFVTQGNIPPTRPGRLEQCLGHVGGPTLDAVAGQEFLLMGKTRNGEDEPKDEAAVRLQRQSGLPRATRLRKCFVQPRLLSQEFQKFQKNSAGGLCPPDP